MHNTYHVLFTYALYFQKKYVYTEITSWRPSMHKLPQVGRWISDEVPVE